ncbi:prolyl oligopeptidase family serine peptidase [Streptomyces sp. NPDC020667]|uniref:S9 family peptidase n=1 Tax=Streptomyces sp. NPDC020667 TaxID=3154895 RepID=UPI0033CF8A3A
MDISAFPRRFALSRRFSLGAPARFAVSPDGRRVVFTRTRGGLDPLGELWLYADGRERLLASPEMADGPIPEAERIRRERARERTEGIVSYATDRDVRLVVHTVGGALHAVRTSGGPSFPLPAVGPAVDARPSPDGRHVAYVSEGALRVMALDGTERLCLAPEAPEVTYGLAEHAAAESMGRRRGYWWAPDGSALLVARVDPTPMPLWHLGDPADPAKPPRAFRYPAAGTANAEVTLHAVSLDGGRTEVLWERAEFEYLATAHWDAHGPVISVQSRDQRLSRVLAVDPATGATRPLWQRQDPAWVELVPGTPARTASGTPVAPWEKDGTRGLEVGDYRTPDGLQLAEVLGTDRDRVLFTAWDGPFERHVYSYEPETGLTRLSRQPGVHTAAMGGPTVVLDSQTPNGHTVTVLRDGEPVGTLRSLVADPLVVPRPEFLTLGGRELPGTLFLPSWHEPGTRKLPVLLFPYSGPGLRLAVRARTWAACVAQWFAEQGFAVLTVDGRGTPGRGPVWEKAVHGDQLTPVLEDQIDGLRAAAAHCPDLDLGRVGIRGWSFGGTLAAAAVLRHPEVFHAAVSGAAPSDQRLYDTHWKERFLGHPDEQPENYARSSTIHDAPLLRRPLLLVHGMADDNVAAAHTLRMSAALLAAGRPHSVLPLSGATHMAGGGTAGQLLLFELNFLRNALGG